MFKLKPSPRELVLLLVLAGLCLGVAWYLLLFTPLNDQLIASKQQLAAGQVELAERQQWQLHDAQTSQQLATLLTQRDELQIRFDPISSFKDITDYVSRLMQTSSSELSTMEVTSEKISLNILSPSYDRAKMIVDDMEKSPNFVLLQSQIGLSEGDSQVGYGLALQAAITWGQRQPDGAESYIRVTPFGR